MTKTASKESLRTWRVKNRREKSNGKFMGYRGTEISAREYFAKGINHENVCFMQRDEGISKCLHSDSI